MNDEQKKVYAISTFKTQSTDNKLATIYEESCDRDKTLQKINENLDKINASLTLIVSRLEKLENQNCRCIVM